MRALALIVFLAAALPVQAQLYKCIDERGRTYYTDKPGPKCKAGPAAPAAPAARSAPPPDKSARVTPASAKQSPPKAPRATAKAAPAAKAKAAEAPRKLSAQERAQLAARCRTYQEQYDWLSSPRSQGVQNREAQLGQIKSAMRECG
jgi:hypothetical protein